MVREAFNTLTKIHSRSVTLKRLGSPDLSTTCRITPSNYFRNLEGPSHTTIKGREFVISIDSIAVPFTPVIKRGDKLIDTQLGSMAIDEIIEMYDFGGAIMGYRVRAE